MWEEGENPSFSIIKTLRNITFLAQTSRNNWLFHKNRVYFDIELAASNSTRRYIKNNELDITNRYI